MTESGERMADDSPKNTHILDGEAEDLVAECEAYEAKIKAVGGIDLFLGGIGTGGFKILLSDCVPSA